MWRFVIQSTDYQNCLRNNSTVGSWYGFLSQYVCDAVRRRNNLTNFKTTAYNPRMNIKNTLKIIHAFTSPSTWTNFIQ